MAEIIDPVDENLEPEGADGSDENGRMSESNLIKNIHLKGNGSIAAEYIRNLNQNTYVAAKDFPENNLRAVNPSALEDEPRDTSITVEVAKQLEQLPIVVIGVPEIQLASKLLRKLYRMLAIDNGNVGLWQISYGDGTERKFQPWNGINEVIERGFKRLKGKHKNLIYCYINTADSLRYATDFFSRGLDSNKTALLGANAQLAFFACDRQFGAEFFSKLRNNYYGNIQPLEFLPWSWIWPTETFPDGTLAILENQYHQGSWGENLFTAFESAKKLAHLSAHELTVKIGEKGKTLGEAAAASKIIRQLQDDSSTNEEMIIERTILFSAIEFGEVSGAGFRFMIEALLEEANAPQDEQDPSPTSVLPSRMQDDKQIQGKKVYERPLERFRRSPDKFMKNLGLIMENGKVKFKKTAGEPEFLKSYAEANWFFFEEQSQKVLSKHLLFDPEASEEVIGLVCRILERLAKESPGLAIKRPLEMLADRVELLLAIRSVVLKLEKDGDAEDVQQLLNSYLVTMGQGFGDVAISKRLHAHLFSSVRSATLDKSLLINELIEMLCSRGYRLITSDPKVEQEAIVLLTSWVNEKSQFVRRMMEVVATAREGILDESDSWIGLLRTILIQVSHKDLMHNPTYWILLRTIHLADGRQANFLWKLLAWKEGGAVSQRVLYDYARTSIAVQKMVARGEAKKYRLEDYCLFHNISNGLDWQIQLENLVINILKQKSDGAFYIHQHHNFDEIEHPGDLFEKWLLLLEDNPEMKEHLLRCLKKHIKRDLPRDHPMGLRSLIDWWAISRNYYPKKYREATTQGSRGALTDRMEACKQLILRLR